MEDARHKLMEATFGGTLDSVDRLEAENLSLRRELRDRDQEETLSDLALARANGDAKRNRNAFAQASFFAAFFALAAIAGWVAWFLKG